MVENGKTTKKLKETEQGLRYVRLPYGHVHHPKGKHFIKIIYKKMNSIKKNKNITVKDYENSRWSYFTCL